MAIQKKAGSRRQIRTTVTDISDRVQTREALRQSEERYRLLFNEMIGGYALHEIIFDSKGKPVDCLILKVNKTIEKVRRISRDLSPSVLVDLGLTAALRWMINSFAKHSNTEISTDIMDTKDLFSIDQQIAI